MNDRSRDLLPAVLIPQSNDLGAVRLILEAVAAGDVSTRSIELSTGISRRQVAYGLHAALRARAALDRPGVR